MLNSYKIIKKNNEHICILSTDAFLQIETSLGGIWRYPLRLVAIEPPPDDTISKILFSVLI